MLKAVLETDVLVGSILAYRGNKYLLRRAWEAGEFQPVLSKSLLEKALKALSRRSLKRDRIVTEHDVWCIEDLLKRDGVIVDDSPRGKDALVATARAAQAGYIVRDIRPSKELNYAGGIRVMNPGEFLRLLERRRRFLGGRRSVKN